jgi:hypothetical protein
MHILCRVTASKIAEEVLPGKETSGSREQRRDQKRAVGDALHGAHRDKEEGRVSAHTVYTCTALEVSGSFEHGNDRCCTVIVEQDGLAISEGTLMGGDSRDDYGR